MQPTTIFAALLLCTVGATANEASSHPIVKVMNLLKKLKEQAQDEGKTEAIAFDKFMYWCSTNKALTSEAISEETAEDEVLDATVDGKTKEDKSLRSRIGKLEGEITDREASEAAMVKDRKEDETMFKLSDKEFDMTIEAVEEALAALQDTHDHTEDIVKEEKIAPKEKIAEEEGEEEEEEGEEKLALLAKAKQAVQKVVSLIQMKAAKHEVKALAKFADEPIADIEAPEEELPEGEVEVEAKKARPKQKAKGDRAAHVDDYSFKSGSVVELLKKLRLKFQDAKRTAIKREGRATGSFKVAKLAEDDAIHAAEKSKDGKTVELSDTDADLAEAAADDKVVVADLEGDTTKLADVTKQCEMKTQEWEERSKTRTAEIAAMDKAVEILSKVSGVRSEAPENPMMPAPPLDAEEAASFLQVDSVVSDPTKMKAIMLVRQAAKKAHSKALERLAQALKAHSNGPFDDMNNMIQKMIQRLMAEQTSEDEHKLWCDKELQKTQNMVDDKTDKSENLHADIEATKAKVAVLTEDIKNANQAVADMESYMKESAEIRQVGHEENEKSLKDAKDAQTALANALSVITENYKNSGEVKKEAWEFVQVGSKAAPATWDAGYTGTEGGGDAIIGILKNCASDFASMEADTQAQEEMDQHEFDKMMSETKIEKARRAKESEMKDAEKARKVEKITSLTARAKDTDAELDKANQYATDLKPACVNGDSSYEDRKAARDAEIEALHSAQDTLTNAFKGGFLQKRSRFAPIKPRK